MSKRQVARLLARREQQEPQRREESDEDQDEEPFVQQRQTFHGLEVSSDSSQTSDSETEVPAHIGITEPNLPTSSTPGPSRMQQRASANIPKEDKHGAKKKIYTEAQVEKKSRKSRKDAKKLRNLKVPAGVDEVEWVTEHLNETLGDPPQRVEEMVVDRREQRKKRLFYINPDHLNVNHELAKVYGNDDLRSPHPPNRRASHWIGVSPEVNPIRIKGIGMTCYKTEGHVKFFRFTHSHEYRARCESLIKKIVDVRLDRLQLTTLYVTDCVEAYLENCDILYGQEEHFEGRKLLEQSLFCLQQVAEPSFSYTDGNTRLLYEFVENRPFLIALLKYVHALSNTAMHITALALGKVLLSLDPSDPLAVSFIIDTLAIRGREYNWLISYIDDSRAQYAHRLFNMRYSRALALFNLARRTQESEIEADAALSKAIISYPSVVPQLIVLGNIAVPDDIKNHVLFNPAANYPVPSRQLQELICFYAGLMAPRWREPYVSKWFIKVLINTIAQYNESRVLRKKALDNARLVAQLYRQLPLELRRHLYVIRAMSSYIGGGQMPPMPQHSVSFNPFPTRGKNTDTYNYFRPPEQAQLPNSLLMGLIGSIYPNIDQLGTRILAATRHSQQIREEIISLMNRSQVGVLRVRDQELPLATEDYELFEQFFVDSPHLPEILFEPVEVDYEQTVIEENDYFTEVLVTDEERELPTTLMTLLLLFSCMFLRAIDRNEAVGYAQQLDSEPAFEEPPIE